MIADTPVREFRINPVLPSGPARVVTARFLCPLQEEARIPLLPGFKSRAGLFVTRVSLEFTVAMQRLAL